MGMLMVPAVIAIVVFSSMLAGRVAVGAAARDAARAYVRSDDGEQALARAQAMADLALRERGIDAAAQLRIDCSADPCLSPGATVEVRVTASIELPYLGGTADVSQAQVFAVDEFRQERR